MCCRALPRLRQDVSVTGLRRSGCRAEGWTRRTSAGGQDSSAEGSAEGSGSRWPRGLFEGTMAWNPSKMPRFFLAGWRAQLPDPRSAGTYQRASSHAGWRPPPSASAPVSIARAA